MSDDARLERQMSMLLLTTLVCTESAAARRLVSELRRRAEDPDTAFARAYTAAADGLEETLGCCADLIEYRELREKRERERKAAERREKRAQRKRMQKPGAAVRLLAERAR